MYTKYPPDFFKGASTCFGWEFGREAEISQGFPTSKQRDGIQAGS
jgi:hypothetical protein